MLTRLALLVWFRPGPKTLDHKTLNRKTLNQFVSPSQGAVTQATVRIWALPYPFRHVMRTG